MNDLIEHFNEVISSATVIKDPFPHVEISNIFPDWFFKQIISNKIPNDCLQTLQELKRTGYFQPRKVLNITEKITILPDSMRPFWQSFYYVIVEQFKPIIANKFEVNTQYLHDDVLYVRDAESYSLGPHTDSTKKVLTCLFYIPDNNFNSDLGTSIYKPLKSNFVCEGGPHHDRKYFELIKTSSYCPNTMFAFKKTNHSFHGVEQINRQIDRDLIIYDIQKQIA